MSTYQAVLSVDSLFNLTLINLLIQRVVSLLLAFSLLSASIISSVLYFKLKTVYIFSLQTPDADALLDCMSLSDFQTYRLSILVILFVFSCVV